MGDVRLGVLLWSQATDWPSFERAAVRIDELGYESLWTWDHLYAIFGDPLQPIFEGYTTLAAWAKVTVERPHRAAGRRQHVPQSGTRRQDRLDHRPHQRRAGDPRHRRRVDGAGAHGAWHRLRIGLRRAPDLDGRGGRRDARAARRRDGHLAGRRPVSVRRARPSAPAAAGAPADHDRWVGGEEDPAHRSRSTPTSGTRWAASRSCDARSSVLREHCEAVGRDPAEITFTAGCKPIIRDTEAEARKLVGVADGTQPHADGVTSRTTTRFGWARRSRSPSG